MRDVKNYICRTLDMHGLIEDDHGMELLVAGRIVSLDLPIARVYERVWEAGRAPPPPSAATGSSAVAAAAAAAADRIAARVSSDPSYCPPMPVVYRLQVRVESGVRFLVPSFWRGRRSPKSEWG
jgi:E3 ubiquitin-protein ligase UBR4